jgi:hypothetical protein
MLVKRRKGVRGRVEEESQGAQHSGVGCVGWRRRWEVVPLSWWWCRSVHHGGWSWWTTSTRTGRVDNETPRFGEARTTKLARWLFSCYGLCGALCAVCCIAQSIWRLIGPEEVHVSHSRPCSRPLLNASRAFSHVSLPLSLSPQSLSHSVTQSLSHSLTQ